MKRTREDSPTLSQRQIPYQDAQNDTVALSWIKKGEKESIPIDCPKAYGHIIQQAWEVLEKRPQAKALCEALEHARPPALSSTVEPLRKDWFPVPVCVVPGESAYYEGLTAFHHAQYTTAKVLFEEAADQAYPAAYLWLGRLYQYDGLIGPQNSRLSQQYYDIVGRHSSWFIAQANTGCADAQCNLGRCYEFGIGVDKNEKEAMHYYQCAATQGYANAQTQLKILFEKNPALKKPQTGYSSNFFVPSTETEISFSDELLLKVKRENK